MQFHRNPNSKVIPERIPIEPLTRCSPDDGKVYQRSVPVEKQIEEALILTPSELLERAKKRDYHSADYLQEECLVYLIRAYHRLEKGDLVNALAEVLLQRCSKRIFEKLRALSSQDSQDAYQDAVGDLFRQILDLASDRGDFLQVRFWFVLNRISIAHFRLYSTRENQEQQNVPLSSLAGYDEFDEGEESRRKTVTIDESVDSSLSLERRTLALEGLNILPEPHRTAFLLRYVYGWPTEHQDSTVPSISRYFQKTSRTIRLWLSQAEKILACWRGETDDKA